MNKILTLIFCFILGLIAGFYLNNSLSNSYTIIKIPDSETKYGDLIILNTKTGDFYKTNESTGYKNTEKHILNK